MEQILKYIKKKYNPISIILYGSYADGTNNQNSDFDALVISADYEQYHDTSFVNDIQLDVFVYPVARFNEPYDCNDFVQLFDGKIVLDSKNVGKTLKENVLSYLQTRPQKTEADIKADIDWCVKMLERTKRNDTEGTFRWHWLLVDSLEIFCNIRKAPYYGPKKALKWMKENHPNAFLAYQRALTEFTFESLANWISYIKTI